MNNNPNNNLNDFLNKSKQNLNDDFEKDALEGFDMLDSKEEAFELKAALDKKIAPLFTEKKQNYRVIWYAAAGLFLIIGLTVYFIQTNNDIITNNKNVSLVNAPKQEAIEAKPDSKITTINPGSTTEKKAEEKKNESSVDRKVVSYESPKEIAQKSEGYKTSTVNNEQASGRSYGKVLDNISLAKENSKSGVNTNSGAGNSTISDDAEGKKTPVAMGGIANDETTKNSKDQQGDFVNGTFASTTSPNKSLAEDNDKSYEEKESDVKKRAVITSGKNKFRKKTKEEESPKTQPAMVSSEQQSNGPKYKADESNNNSNADSNTELEVTTKSVASSDKANQCYYRGGEVILMKDIAEKLIAKNVNKKFNAVLFINETKQVKKVDFTKDYKLGKDEKKLIENELKTLTNFNFYIAPTAKTLFEYKLEYRP